MSNLQRFAAYAAAFEESYADDNWTRLEQYFAPDAVYLPGDGTESVGRDAVLETLRNSVNKLDRRFENRTLTALSPPTEDGDTVTLAWKAAYKSPDAQSLTISGKEYAKYSDGVIERLEDAFDAEAVKALQQWMADSAS